MSGALLYIWGDDEVYRSFDSLAEFVNYVKSRYIDAPAAASSVPSGKPAPAGADDGAAGRVLWGVDSA